MKKLIYISLIAIGALISCKNDKWEFPDYKYSTVYFAYQSPIRTIVLGEDVFDTSLDNQHKCKIMATTGGVYENKKNITVDFKVDNTLCDGVKFKESSLPVVAMPSNYYTLATNSITIPSGSLSGGVEVQLTDAFFADPKSIDATYVIPLVMTTVKGADSILVGKSQYTSPDRMIAGQWSVQPKDYILYAIKYINQWHANYLRRGKDDVVGKGGFIPSDTAFVRHAAYVEKDQVVKLTTKSMQVVELPLTLKYNNKPEINFTLILTFDGTGKCAVSSNSADYTATGTGKYVVKGEKNSWGNQDRDVLYLDYAVDFAQIHTASKDTLVIRDRGVKMETFTIAK